MIPLLIQAAQEMDSIFWREVYPDRDSLLRTVADSATRAYIDLNYGPWDRLDGNQPFVPGVGPRPAGAAFYPSDMGKAEFEAAARRRRRPARRCGATIPSSGAIPPAGSRPCRITRRSPSPPGARPPSCARPPGWPTTRD